VASFSQLDSSTQSKGNRKALSLRSVLAPRPPIAWSLALLFLFKGLVCLMVIAFPISPTQPNRLIALAGILAAFAATGTWLFGRRLQLIGFELLAAGGSLMTSVMVAHASTHGGMMITAFAYPWIAIYAAHFFPRRGMVLVGLLISISFGVSLLMSRLSHVGIYWLVVTATIWSICLLLGQLSESLRRLADTDQLTGLLNRSGLRVAAERERAVADRLGARLTLAVLDLDDFKQVNDSKGHAAGDEVLTGLGAAWREALRGGDILARHGGDEFVLLLPNTTPSQAQSLLDRLHRVDVTVRWSAGVSEWCSGESLDACMARADRKLYTIKLNRRAVGSPTEEMYPSFAPLAQ
jgi:diguanylate cyclase (GGDEF)-like protein